MLEVRHGFRFDLGGGPGGVGRCRGLEGGMGAGMVLGKGRKGGGGSGDERFVGGRRGGGSLRRQRRSTF